MNREFKTYNIAERNESFPHAYCLSGNKLYFSTLFNNLLYELDLDTLDLKDFILPNDLNCEFGYRQAVEYKKRIFLIPEREKHIIVFQEGKVISILSRGGYSSCGIKQEKIYLLDRKRSCVDIFDMSTCGYVGEYLLPRHDDGENYYIDILMGQDVLYVSSGVERKILIIHLDKGDLEYIKTDDIVCHGALFKDKIYYTSTKKDLDGIYAFDIEKGDSEKVATIDYKNKTPIKYYRFWNTKLIDGSVFFCPHEESVIIRYCIETNEVDYINAFGPESRTLRADKSNAVYGVERFGDRLVVMPYCGNEIAIVSMKGRLCNRIKIPIDKRKIAFVLNGYLKENKIDIIPEGFISLEDYLGLVSYGDRER